MRRAHVVVAMAAALFFAAGLMVPVQAQTVPGPVVLKGNPMGGVKFDHKAHVANGAKCTDCHHAAKEGMAMKAPQEKCSDCHTKTAKAPMKTNYKSAFHDATAKSGTCISCHQKALAAGKKPPTKCNECHKNENG